jgi:hypothetical protein
VVTLGRITTAGWRPGLVVMKVAAEGSAVHRQPRTVRVRPGQHPGTGATNVSRRHGAAEPRLWWCRPCRPRRRIPRTSVSGWAAVATGEALRHGCRTVVAMLPNPVGQTIPEGNRFRRAAAVGMTSQGWCSGYEQHAERPMLVRAIGPRSASRRLTLRTPPDAVEPPTSVPEAAEHADAQRRIPRPRW